MKNETTASDPLDWHTHARRYLDRLGLAEWQSQGSPVPKRAGSARYCPTDYHRNLIDALNRNDEVAFKSMKMLEGYASAVGH